MPVFGGICIDHFLNENRVMYCFPSAEWADPIQSTHMYDLCYIGFEFKKKILKFHIIDFGAVTSNGSHFCCMQNEMLNQYGIDVIKSVYDPLLKYIAQNVEQ